MDVDLETNLETNLDTTHTQDALTTRREPSVPDEGALRDDGGGEGAPGDIERLLSEYQTLLGAHAALRQRKEQLEVRVRQGEERRRAMVHIMDDLNTVNRKLADQRKAMIHILADYEQDRSRLAKQTERLDNSRRALMHILRDSHSSNLRLEDSRKAMIHIMGDLRETTAEMQRREQELREKQEQLIQAGKLATLGELTTGIAHELNNPLNNIGLFVGNAIDLIAMGSGEKERILRELESAMRQVRKATEIITHLRTFGRAAPVSREPVAINQVVERALSLTSEQLRLRQIAVEVRFAPEDPIVYGSAIQLEQVCINLLTNARDALASAPIKRITITTRIEADAVLLAFHDTGSGIAEGMEQRVFDPFFTTKEVGKGTGLGLSITYGIIQEHQGTITVESPPGDGATFLIQLPLGIPEEEREELLR
jgi:C4-dicarboxylate-specific signal transduction histidine kinase